jgi:hypothetical protein
VLLARRDHRWKSPSTTNPAKKKALLARFSSSRRTKPATSHAKNTTAVTTIQRMRCGAGVLDRLNVAVRGPHSAA